MTTQPVPPDRAAPFNAYFGQGIAFVVGLATGGTASHVIALAAGCRAAGLTVSVLAPSQTLELFGDDVDTVAVHITDRPRLEAAGRRGDHRAARCAGSRG